MDAREVTAQDGKGSADVSQGPALIRSAGEAYLASGIGLKTVIGDRAYDARGCYQAARDIDAELLVALANAGLVLAPVSVSVKKPRSL